MAQPEQDVWIPQTIGERLILIMRRRGLRASELVRRVQSLGVALDAGAFSRWLNGRSRTKDGQPERLSLPQLLAIAKILQVSMAALGVTQDAYPELRLMEELGFIVDAVPPSDDEPLQPGGGSRRRRNHHAFDDVDLFEGLQRKHGSAEQAFHQPRRTRGERVTRTGGRLVLLPPIPR